MNSSVWKNPVVFMVWCWCLLRANHKKSTFPFNGADIEILPGQFISGRDSAIKELGTLTPQQWRTAIKYLKSTSRITIQSTNKFSLFTVTKWYEYQTDNQQPNQPLTNEQPTTNQPLTTDKNVENEKNEKNLSERKLVDPKTGKKPTTASGWTRAKRVSLGKEPNMEKKEIPPELLEVDTWVKDHRAMAERNGDDYTFLDDGDNKRMRGQIGKFIPKWIAIGKTRNDFFQKLEVNQWAKERGYNPFLVYTEAMMTSLLIGGEQKSKRVNLVDIDK